MFDKYHIDLPDVHHHTTIEQLPHDTADAARLYGEMVEKARSEVRNATLEAFGANNELKIIRLASEFLVFSDTHRTRCIFSINGYEYDVCVSDFPDAKNKMIEKIAHHVAAEVASTLAKRLIK